MDWLSHNWYWLLGLILVIFWLSKKSSSKATISNQQAAMLIDALVEAFDSILATMLQNHYSAQDRRKIAVGMVAIMAASKISLEKMKDNPDLVIAVAAQSAALLTQRGEIAAI